MSVNSVPSNEVLPDSEIGPVTPDAEQEDLTQVEGSAEDPADQPEVVAVAEVAAEDEVASQEPEGAESADETSAEKAEATAEVASEEETVSEETVEAEAVEEAAEADEAVSPEEEAVEEAAEVDEAVSPEDEVDSSSVIRRGAIIEGIVEQTSPTEIRVKLPEDVVGIVSGRELARMDQKSLEDLQIGNPVLVFILNPKNRSGQAVLSLNRAQEERDWRQAEEYHKSEEVYTGKVSGYNKGGLIVRFGRVRGFVPASQVSEPRRINAVGDSPAQRWAPMIGEEIMVKVVEVDRNRNRLILSERAADKVRRNKKKADLLETLVVGDIRKGRVVSLTEFGAFVDLGGADGLIHLTELSWKHVTKPSEIVSVGQEVEVEVISLDRQRRRIGLSMKSLEGDPWDRVVSIFQVGQLVKGSITKLTKFGAFACLDDAPEIEGLIHISELAEHRVGHPREVVKEGEALTLRIVKIDRAQRRMGLSLKQVDAEEYLEIDLATYGSESEPLLDGIDLSTNDPEPDVPEASEPDAEDAE